MKIFTLISLSALLLGSTTASAQLKLEKHDFFKKMPSFCTANAPKAQKAKRLQLRSVKSTPRTQALWLPQHETEYAYEDGEWVSYGDYYYVYDKKGNILVNTYTDGEMADRYVNSYNEKGQITEQIYEYAEDGENFVPQQKRIQELDPIVESLVTLRVSYSWNAETSEWEDVGNGYKREVTRNEDGNVTSVMVSSPYDGEFVPVQRQIITYDPDLKLAETYRFERNAQDPGISTAPIWETSIILKKMTWQATDGQLVSEYNEWFRGINKLKTAEIWTMNGTEEERYGTVTATYQEDGSYLMVLDLPGENAYQTGEYKVLDENGSYTYEIKYFFDVNGDGKFTEDELDQHGKVEEHFDSKGNITFYEQFDLNADTGVLEQIDGSKTEYTYGGEHGELTETLSYMWEPEYDDEDNLVSSSYVPDLKYVADDFTDVTITAINDATADSANAATVVYNLQGVQVGTSTDGLAKGVYLVKQGGKVQKVLKR